MATLKSIGQKIAQERTRQKLSQEDLAGIVDMDRSFLSYIENGRKNFSVDMLLRLSDALKIKPSKLFE
ncbi:MAG: helix-turn-helix transcriptional regulator [Alphaproteobacteria bacterium]|nr:helix-turn-helix transcriptional regulator [Alphaproteobacteria bacterium]